MRKSMLLVQTDDPFDRYTNSLVEVYERYGINAGGTDDTTAISEADAAFRIAIGAEDTLRLADGTTVVGDATATEDAAVTAARALNGRVTIGATSVLVDLSNEWRAGGEIVIMLRNVRTAVPRSLSRPDGMAPYHSYPVAVKSKRAGRLDLLDPVLIDHDGDAADADPSAEIYTTQPTIRVGNILGTRTDDSTADGVHHYGRDQIARDFKIEPDVVYEGETDKTFRITYTANGPMYSITPSADVTAPEQASILITIPPELQDRTTGANAVPLSAQNVSVIARGRVLPSGNLSVGPEATDPDPDPEVVIDATAGTARINIDRIDMGATITLTYHLRGQDADENEETDPESLIDVDSVADDAARDMMVSAFEITTTVPEADATAGTATAATMVTGGKIHAQAGSGTMTMTAPSR